MIIEFIESPIIYVLNLVASFWGLVSFYPWYFLYGGKQRRDIVQARPAVSRDPSSPYRCVEHYQNILKTPINGVYTLDKLLRYTASKHGSKPCLGTRELLSSENEVQANGRVFSKVVLGNYNWLSYNEVLSKVESFGCGLLALGQRCKQNIVIFADTRAEWMIAAQSCFAYNFPVVTLYATLGEEAIVYGINQVEVEVVITDGHLLKKLQTVAGQLKTVKTIIYIGDVNLSDLSQFPKHVKVSSMSEVERIGSRNQNLSHPRIPPCPEDTAVIMYTSGSTGLPKGVMISHANLIANVAGMSDRVNNESNDVYIGYLPLAHVFELAAELVILSKGSSIGYSSPLTLSDQSSKIKKGSKGDANVLKPTLMSAVPAIMDRIRHNVLDKVKEQPWIRRLLFKFCYDYKLEQVKQGYDTPLINRFIFKKTRELLGGNIRCMLSGGAPLSEDTQYFMNVCMCCPVIQGYGLTETCAGGTICNLWDTTCGRAGVPIGCTEVKLVSWEEGGYTPYDKPNPRGEVVLGGANITMGYFKMPEKTKESFYVDRHGQRWFHTGDIGEMDPDGCLRIIDRKKDLVKLHAGEYVSLGKVEAVLSRCSLVESVCLYAEAGKTYAVALIVPRAKEIAALAKSLNLNPNDMEALCENPTVVSKVMQLVEATAKSEKLEKFEIPKKIKLCRETWTPETDLVTQSLKLKRRNIATFYAQSLKAMYQ